MSPIAVILIPFIGALAIALAAGQPKLRDALGWLAAIAFFVGVIQQVGPVLEGAGREQLLWTLLPGLDLALRVEPLGLVFALVASALWLVATLYAQSYMKVMNYPHLGRFFACYTLSLGAVAGVAFADDLITLFIFYEILTISTYPLVTHSGNDKARHAGRVYLGFLLGTSIGLLLVAILWTYFATGTVTFREGGILAGQVDKSWLPLLAGLFFFGIGKAALMPVHPWLPAAMVAPAPVSALLHAVAVVKVGGFTIIKVAVYVFGIDLLAETSASIWIAWVAGFTIISASVIALRMDDLKSRLAYSTVAQLSYIALGALVATPLALIGAVMQLAFHAMAKITLFFAAGAIQVAHQRKKISQLNGLGRVMPLTFGAFTLASLSIIGLPLGAGLWSKWYLLIGVLDAGQWLLALVLLASSLLTIAYLLSIPVRAFFLPPDADTPTDRIREAPWPMVTAMLITSGLCVFFFFRPDLVFDLAAMLIDGGAT